MLELRRPSPGDTPLEYDSAVASEQMFFWGAPLAHVVRYEDHLRDMRRRSAMRRLKPMRGKPAYSRGCLKEGEKDGPASWVDNLLARNL
jgi:hypothetical protein